MTRARRSGPKARGPARLGAAHACATAVLLAQAEVAPGAKGIDADATDPIAGPPPAGGAAGAFVLDEPSLFLVQENTTGAAILIGRVVRPG